MRVHPGTRPLGCRACLAERAEQGQAAPSVQARRAGADSTEGSGRRLGRGTRGAGALVFLSALREPFGVLLGTAGLLAATCAGVLGSCHGEIPSEGGGTLVQAATLCQCNFGPFGAPQPTVQVDPPSRRAVSEGFFFLAVSAWAMSGSS